MFDSDLYKDCVFLSKNIPLIEASIAKFNKTFPKGTRLQLPAFDGHEIRYGANGSNIYDDQGYCIATFAITGNGHSFVDTIDEEICIRKPNPNLLLDYQSCLKYNIDRDTFYVDDGEAVPEHHHPDDLEALHFMVSTTHDIDTIDAIREKVECYTMIRNNMTTLLQCNVEWCTLNIRTLDKVLKAMM